MLRRMASWLVYPALTVASTAAAVAAFRRGAPAPIVAGGLLLFLAVVIELCEHALPFEPAWRRPRGDVRTDVLHYLFSSRALEVGAGLSLWALGAAGAALWPGGSPWPSAWPVALQIALALVLAELPSYWLHRAEHTWRPLWKLHSVHHSAERLYWLNSVRSHPLDNLLTSMASLAPLALLGAGEELLLATAVYGGVHGMLQHANIDIRLGPLNWVLSSCQVHRWHHSRALSEANANYGTILLVWDVVFGTRRVPARRPPVDVGLAGPALDFPPGYLGQLASPWAAALWAPDKVRPGPGKPGGDSAGPPTLLSGAHTPIAGETNHGQAKGGRRRERHPAPPH
jgi:ornithine lipid hydroxylase